MATSICFVALIYNMHLSYHHGIGILAAVAKEAGARVNVYQIHTELERPPVAKKCADEISSFHPDVVCISSSTLEWSFARELADELKKVSRAKIIIGGSHPTFCANLGNDLRFFDYVVVGEGEKIVENLACGRWYDSKVIRGEMVENLDTLPFSDRESFDMQKIIDARDGIIDFITQRGCPYNCSYCSNHVLRRMYGTKFLRRRSVENVLDEMKKALGTYKCHKIFFHDDIFTLDEKWTKEFCLRYAREIGLPWMINSHVGHVSNSIIQSLASAGCTEIKLGVESGDEEIRNKILNKRVSNSQIKERFKAVREAGMRSYAFMMHGTPGETETSYRKSVQLMADIQPDVVRSTVFHPLPGTCLGDPYFRKSKANFVSMLGDNPSNPLNRSGKVLFRYYTFGWQINLEMGLKGYKKLAKKYRQKTSFNPEEIKEDDVKISTDYKELSRYHFGAECSMLKLEKGKDFGK